MKKSIIADISLFFVAVIWGGGFVAVKDALSDIKPFYMVGIRFFFASILLALIFYRKMKCVKKREVIGGIVVGLFLFGGFAAQTSGLLFTTPGKQAFLTAVYVVMVPFLYWIIKKRRPDIYSIFAAVLTFIGIGLLTVQESLSFNFGDALTLLCALMFALQIVAIDYYADSCDPVVLSVIQMLVAAILSFIFAFIYEPVPSQIKSSAYLSLAYLIIFSSMLAFLIQNVAQKYTFPTHAAIIMCMESVFGAFFSVIFLGEVFTINKILGCAIIFIAIIISETKLNIFRIFFVSKGQYKK